MRRAVGSIAWCVLEHLAETAEDRAGNTVSYETVRSTAGALGLANDTVARALRRLADAGLTTYVPGRAVDGRFASSHYRLTFTADVFIGLSFPKPAASASRSRGSRTRPQPADATQLSLIDAVPHTI
jgi:hypothetical protein